MQIVRTVGEGLNGRSTRLKWAMHEINATNSCYLPDHDKRFQMIVFFGSVIHEQP